MLLVGMKSMLHCSKQLDQLSGTDIGCVWDVGAGKGGLTTSASCYSLAQVPYISRKKDPGGQCFHKCHNISIANVSFVVLAWCEGRWFNFLFMVIYLHQCNVIGLGK